MTLGLTKDWIGSLTVAVIAWRHADEFHQWDEISMLAMGILLFASGSMLRLRWTTVTGALLLVVAAAIATRGTRATPPA